jgi:hypothetical protein
LSLLLVLAAAAALGASAGAGFFAASRSRAKTPKQGSKQESAPAAANADPLKNAFDGLPLALGDVVIADHEERWLAGCLLAKEGDKIVAALFFAPEGATLKMVAAFARPRKDLLWLTPARVDSPAEPPASIEIDGVPMTRRGRLPVLFSPHGQGVPRLGETGIFAEYEGGADEMALLVTSEGRALAWSGRRLGEGQYDRLGSGGDGS